MRVKLSLVAIAVGGALALPITQAAANSACHDLWFTRNLIMDRAGYCFSTPLGRAVFYNGDCVGVEVEPDPAYRETLAQVIARESELECRVYTGLTELDLDDVDLRRRMIDLPVVDPIGGIGCIGWRGPQTELRVGRSAEAPGIGFVRPGDLVVFLHAPVDGWWYARALDEEHRLRGAGWLEIPDPNALDCDGYAG